MLKLVPTTFGERGPLFYKNSKIDWKYIQMPDKKQEVEGLHAANRSTKRHVQFKEAKMNVRLAAQTLSGSVSSALEFLQLIDSNFADAGETAQFGQIINDAFDIMSC